MKTLYWDWGARAWEARSGGNNMRAGGPMVLVLVVLVVVVSLPDALEWTALARLRGCDQGPTVGSSVANDEEPL